MKLSTNRFVSADLQLSTLSRLTDITFTNPVNGQEEKDNFIASLRKGHEYNPLYEYNIPTQELTEGERVLSSLNFDKSSVGQLFTDLVDETRRRIRMVCTVGREGFTANAISVYGAPSLSLVDKAKRILLSVQPEKINEEKNISTNQLAERFFERLKELSCHWKIEISQRAFAKVNVIPGREIIEIRADEHFSEGEAQRLLVHEINAHLLRALNGGFQPFRIFATGLADSERTDEGLATIVEELTHTIRSHTFRLYAGRVLASHLTQTRSFYEVFVTLREYFGEDDAFYITQRVKRGLSNTERPGGLIKDYIYLDGREKVRRYLEEGRPISLLYLGNVSVESTKLLEELLNEGVLQSPRYLPQFLADMSGSYDLWKTIRSFEV